MAPELGQRGWRVSYAVAAIVFASWAGFQVNDPDPWPWVLFYGGLALASAVAAARISDGIVAVRAVCMLWAVWGLAWALWILVGAATAPGLGAAAAAFLEDAGEPLREALGLLIGAAWAVGLSRWTRPPPSALQRRPVEPVKK